MDSTEKFINSIEHDYDRMKEVKDFDESKMGVKGLVDAGTKGIPTMFIRPPDELLVDLKTPCIKREVPVINFEGIGWKERYDEIVKEVLYASQNWGFFQVVYHEIPSDVLDKMLEGAKMFHEQDTKTKEEFYTRDFTKQVVYNTNYDLHKSRAANWRDTLYVHPTYIGPLDPEALPIICRHIILEYVNHVQNLSDLLLELLSVALGLKPGHLKEMQSDEQRSLSGHYYPACPAPELTLGTTKHTDPTFITILLQDQIGGLQVLHDNQWIEVQPISGAFVVNIGDILQMVSNDKFKSVLHRVTANRVGPRISVAYFVKGDFTSTKFYGPIKELLSDENPPVYGEFTISEFHTNFFSSSIEKPILDMYRLQNLGPEE